MSIVEQRQQRRDDYLVALYDLSEGNALQWPTHQEIAAVSGIPETEIMNVGQNVSGDNWAKFMTMGGLTGHVAITPAGIRRAERVITEREAAGAPRFSSTVALTDMQLVRSLEPLLATIRTDLETKDVDPAVKPDLQADLESAERQARANRPNRGVIRAALDRIKDNWPAVVAGSIGVAANIVAIIHGL